MYIKKLHSSLIATFANYILRSTENYLNDYKKDYAKRVFSIYLLLHVHVYVISKANTAKCYQCYRWPISSGVHTGRHKGISLQQSIPDYKTHPYILSNRKINVYICISYVSCHKPEKKRVLVTCTTNQLWPRPVSFNLDLYWDHVLNMIDYNSFIYTCLSNIIIK